MCVYMQTSMVIKDVVFLYSRKLLEPFSVKKLHHETHLYGVECFLNHLRNVHLYTLDRDSNIFGNYF